MKLILLLKKNKIYYIIKLRKYFEVIVMDNFIADYVYFDENTKEFKNVHAKT